MSLACLVLFMTQRAAILWLPSLLIVMLEPGVTQSAPALSIFLLVVGAAVPVIFWGGAADRYGRRLSLLLSHRSGFICRQQQRREQHVRALFSPAG